MRIGFSKGGPEDRYQNYSRWLQQVRAEVEAVDLMAEGDPRASLATCDAFVLTGGIDVNPVRYGRPDLRAKCGIVDDDRDILELGLLGRARELNLPVLGICRGLQVLNVALGGTLVADIPSQLGPGVEHGDLGEVDSVHSIVVNRGTLLHKLLRDRRAIVNSAHHQSIDMLAPDLVSTAHADDGVVEAVEWKDPAGKPFMLAVQWHPERMDPEAPAARRIAEHFLFEVETSMAFVARTA